MHFCMDEVRVILMALPFIGGIYIGIRLYWHRIWHKMLHKGSPKLDGCCPRDHKHK